MSRGEWRERQPGVVHGADTEAFHVGEEVGRMGKVVVGNMIHSVHRPWVC